jgi:hypothetical protein
MTKNDKAALKLAMEYAHREPLRAEQLDSKLKGEPWSKVAEFAAYCTQTDALSLKPWESPPCNGDPSGDRPEDKLLRRMLKAGVSRWHPDPMAALAEAKQ